MNFSFSVVDPIAVAKAVALIIIAITIAKSAKKKTGSKNSHSLILNFIKSLF